jgi:hypothetical protein
VEPGGVDCAVSVNTASSIGPVPSGTSADASTLATIAADSNMSESRFLMTGLVRPVNRTLHTHQGACLSARLRYNRINSLVAMGYTMSITLS